MADGPKMDMTDVRYSLARFRKDRRESTPENVFRISTILPNGMSYAEFALFYVLRNKKTGSAPSKRTKPKVKLYVDSSDSASPPLPPTRSSKNHGGHKEEAQMERIDESLLSKRFREVIGNPELDEIGSFTVTKRRKKTAKK